MAGEIIGEIIMFGLEVGIEAAGGDGDNKNRGCGCIVALVCIIGGLAIAYYICKS